MIPGGAKGAETISKDGGVQRLVKDYIEQGKYVGMICAGTLYVFRFIGEEAEIREGEYVLIFIFI